MKQIPLGGKHGTGKFTLVDDADFELVSKYSWSLFVSGYAGACVKGETTLLHRLLMKPRKGLQVDHINGDRLDNRRINLRTCTPAQNCMNVSKHKRVNPSSKYKGVCFRARAKKRVWRCNVAAIELGSFETEIEAALAYDKRVRELYGEFATVNFPNGFHLHKTA